MQTWLVDGDTQWLTVFTQHSKVRLHAILHHLNRTNIIILTKTVGQDWTANTRQNLTDIGIITTDYRQAIERQVMQKLDERIF